MELRNRLVHFRIRDIYLPDPDKVLMGMHGDDLLQGRVRDISDSGVENGLYAVVEVEGVDDVVVVPVDRILGVL